MPAVTLQFAEWMPDQFRLGSPGAAVITNVVPLTPTSYGPFPTASTYTTNGLTGRCIGSYTTRDTAKNVFVFAGDAAKLYLLRAGSADWTDISRAGSPAYTGAVWPDTQWSFTSFGLRVIACNYTDESQTYLVGTDTIFSNLGNVSTTGDTHTNTTLDNLGTTTGVRAGMTATGGSIPAGTTVISVDSSTAVTLSQAAAGTATGVSITFTASVPKAKYCEAIGDHLMLANTFDSVDGVQPQRVWFSAIGDPTNWPTPGTTAAIQVQSDFQDLQQTDLGAITGLVPGPLPTASATIFCEHGVWTALYVGSPAIYSFKVADGAPGCLSPRSIVRRRITAGGNATAVIYYLGEDGFYAFNGTSAVPIGANRVDRTVLAEIDPLQRSVVLGAYDPVRKLVYWAYSTAGATAAYNRMVVFNWDINRWSYIDLTNNTIEWITHTASIGYTLDGLDATGYNMDTLPFSLDSEAWVGGMPAMAVFNSAHRLGYLTGSNMAPTVETVEAELVPGYRFRIMNARPQVDVTGGSVSIGVREREADSVTYKTAVLMNAMGECPQRYTGRYARARYTLPAASSFTHLSGVEIEAMQEGKR